VDTDLIFALGVLNAVVRNLNEPQAFLLDSFFGQEQRSMDDNIYVDIEPYRPRISPFVSPLVAGKVVASEGFTTAVFRPAYVKDKRVFTPNRVPRRMIGERFGGELNAYQRLQALIAQDIVDQLRMWKLRLEVMASEALRTGRNTIVGDEYPSKVVDYLRDSSLTIALAGGLRWGQTGVSPLANIQSWSLSAQLLSGAPPTDWVFDPNAAQLFLADAQVDKLLTRMAYLGREPINIIPQVAAGGGAAPVFYGNLGPHRFWSYQQPYVDVDGTARNVMPANTAIGASPLVQGIRHYGKIRDLEAALQALPTFVKSWLENDPSVRWMLLQSAPLTVPTRSNATVCATVA
jgi:hypothetical protein